MIYFGLNKRKYESDSKLGSGGEGDIYSVRNDPKIVLKIYRKDRNIDFNEKKNKLTFMVKMSDTSGLEYTTWPQDILYDSSGNFTGFTMRRIGSNKKINEIYETSSKVNLNWNSKVRIAANLCTVVKAIHSIGQVCGDFNPNNICLDMQSGLLYIIDTDSFHIINSGTTYRCSVGMPYYLPKELQERMQKGDSLSTMSLPTFTQETDDFALAVHIFQLLMNGCHPFTLGKINTMDSTVAPQVEDNILKGNCGFFKSIYQYCTPVYAPRISDLPDYIQNLFKRAFVDSYRLGPTARPKASEWEYALKRLSLDTKICNVEHQHCYYKGLSECPWCRIEPQVNTAMNSASPIPVKAPTRNTSPGYTNPAAPYNTQVSPTNRTAAPTNNVSAHTSNNINANSVKQSNTFKSKVSPETLSFVRGMCYILIPIILIVLAVLSYDIDWYADPFGGTRYTKFWAGPIFVVAGAILLFCTSEEPNGMCMIGSFGSIFWVIIAIIWPRFWIMLVGVLAITCLLYLYSYIDNCVNYNSSVRITTNSASSVPIKTSNYNTSPGYTNPTTPHRSQVSQSNITAYPTNNAPTNIVKKNNSRDYSRFLFLIYSIFFIIVLINDFQGDYFVFLLMVLPGGVIFYFLLWSCYSQHGYIQGFLFCIFYLGIAILWYFNLKMLDHTYYSILILSFSGTLLCLTSHFLFKK